MLVIKLPCKSIRIAFPVDLYAEAKDTFKQRRFRMGSIGIRLQLTLYRTNPDPPNLPSENG